MTSPTRNPLRFPARDALASSVLVAALSAHLSALIRIAGIPFLEGAGSEYHPKVVATSLAAGAVHLAFLMAVGGFLPKTAPGVRRSLETSFGFGVAMAASLVALRQSTELVSGIPFPAAPLCILLVAGFAVLAAGISIVSARLNGSGGWAPLLLAVAAVLATSCSMYIQTQIEMGIFGHYGAQLRAMIILPALLVIALFFMIKHRRSGCMIEGVAGFCGVMILISLMLMFRDRAGESDGREHAAGDRPNVILVTIDTMRGDALGCYGRADAGTPEIDALANDGILFEEAHSTGPWTLPGLAGIFTGEDPWVHQCDSIDRSLWEGFKTPAECFQEAGFLTHAITHNLLVRPEYGFAQGFDRYDYIEPFEERFETHPILRPLSRGLGLTWLLTDSTVKITATAVRFLRRNKVRPFFLWVHLYDPHAPYDPQGRLSGLDPAKADPKVLYAAEVSYVDHAVGRILGELRRNGIYDSSLIVLASDHGDEFMEHGAMSHGHALWRELLHVPLIWKNPGNHGSQRVKEPVLTSWIRATMLAQTGLKTASPANTPLLPGVMDGEASNATGTLHAGGVDPKFQRARSVIQDHWKLIMHENSTTRLLFDLQADKEEQNNLAVQFPQKTSELAAVIEAHRAACEKRRIGLIPDVGVISHDEYKKEEKELKALGYLK